MATTQASTHNARLNAAIVLFGSLEWAFPPYFRFGVVFESADRIRGASDQMQQLDVELQRLYDPEYLAAMLVERYPGVIHVQDFVPAISDAFEASALGNWNGAISTLLPAIEGILRGAHARVSPSSPQGTQWIVNALTARIGRRVREQAIGRLHTDPALLARARQADVELDAMLTGFRDFVRNHLLSHTNNYNGQTHLNRHAVLHGIDPSSFACAGNFYRLVTFLDILCVTFTFDTPGAPVMAPDDTPRSIARARHYRALAALAAARPA